MITPSPIRIAYTDSEWELLFTGWALSPSQSEQTRCDNAVSAIRNAIGKSTALQQRSVKVFPQGSYRNRVNVRQDSDVDVGVLCSDTFYSEVPTGRDRADFVGSYPAASYTFQQFKDELETALVAHFGRSAVTRGNKAFDVHETSHHVEADVVPVMEFRLYSDNGTYRAGVALFPDNGGRIENYPERLLSSWPATDLHYENGIKKNSATGRRFKSVVRIIKKLRNIMAEKGYTEADPIPSYLIECLVYNIDNYNFSKDTWLDTIRTVLCQIWSKTKDDGEATLWREVDEIKYLFHSSQSWTKQQAHAFANKAWEIIGIS